MKKKSKRFREISKNVFRDKKFNINDAIELVKKNATTKFDESIDISLKINLKQSKGGDLSLRTVVNLPNGSGKKNKVAVLCEPEKVDEAKKAGADDAWMVQGGYVTEGTSNNAYIIKNNKIVTRGLSNDILHGITRAAVLRFAKEAQMQVEERNFTLDEAYEADEAFITSASTFVMPVVEIDGNKIGHGLPGSNSSRLREIYLEESKKLAI